MWFLRGRVSKGFLQVAIFWKDFRSLPSYSIPLPFMFILLEEVLRPFLHLDASDWKRETTKTTEQ